MTFKNAFFNIKIFFILYNYYTSSCLNRFYKRLIIQFWNWYFLLSKRLSVKSTLIYYETFEEVIIFTVKKIKDVK